MQVSLQFINFRDSFLKTYLCLTEREQYLCENGLSTYIAPAEGLNSTASCSEGMGALVCSSDIQTLLDL